MTNTAMDPESGPTVPVQETRPVAGGSNDFLRRKEEALAAMAAKYAYVASLGRFVLRNAPLGPLRLSGRDLDLVAARDHAIEYRTANGGIERWHPTSKTLLAARPDMTLDRIDFLPGHDAVSRDEHGTLVLNLWQRPPWELLEDWKGRPTPFLALLRHLFDDEAAIRHMLCWMAHLVQRPGERVNHAVLLTSEAQGIGKSTLGVVLRRLLGERNCGVVQAKDLSGGFDNWIQGKLLVVADEVYEAGNHDLKNRIKPLITEPQISVNIKYGPQTTIRNLARLLLFSNHAEALPIDPQDRRFFVWNSQARPKGPEFYRDLHGYLRSPRGMNEVYTYLARLDLSRWDPHAPPPTTASKEALIRMSRHPLEDHLADAVASGKLLMELGEEFTIRDLQLLLAREGFESEARNRRAVARHLREAGVEPVVSRSDGKQSRKWRLPETALEDAPTDFDMFDDEDDLGDF